MKKNILLIAVLLFTVAAFAQTRERHKIVVFTPLYLDSAFDQSGTYRYEKTGARFSVAGLDFYYGVQLALDSLQRRGTPLDVYLLDSKGNQTIAQQLAKPEMSNVELIIGQTNVAETQMLAENALRKKIPFVSATLPNDAGVSNNPYLVVLNSTLQAHVEAIYRYLQKFHSLDKIVVFKRAGGQEEQLKNYFTEFAKSTMSTPLNIKFVEIGTDFTTQTVAANLDSTKKNICIAGSLDEAFGMRLNQSLSALNKTYPVTVIGMPTWDNYNLNRVKDLEIIYTVPFYYNKGTALENQLGTVYNSQMSNRPSDLFFRGYETMLRFGLLLADTKKDIASSLSRKGGTVFTQLDIQPVFKDRNSMTLDYFENKHLYFIKAFGGVKNIIQ